MRIGIIGCGNMGEAILKGIVGRHNVFVAEPNAERQKMLRKKYKVAIGPLTEVVKAAEVIVLATKPQDFPELLAEMATLPLKNKLIISIAAGQTTRSIEKRLKQTVRVVRCMPNLPAVISQSMTGLTGGSRATSADLKTAAVLFESIGRTVTVKEKMMDGITAVSGSGPAYVFYVVEVWMKAARKLGFSETEAKDLVYQTLLGSVDLLRNSADPAAGLRSKVTSKGGTTAAALDVMMKKDLDGIFTAALKAARDRARELAR